MSGTSTIAPTYVSPALLTLWATTSSRKAVQPLIPRQGRCMQTFPDWRALAPAAMRYNHAAPAMPHTSDNSVTHALSIVVLPHLEFPRSLGYDFFRGFEQALQMLAHVMHNHTLHDGTHKPPASYAS